MESVIRIAVIYFFLLLVLRITGKRTLAESTPFDLIIILIIGDLVQEAIIDEDHSLTGCIIVISTLMFLEVMLTFIKHYFKKIDKTLDGYPMVIVKNGEILMDRMAKAKIDIDDILEAARTSRGYSSLSQVRYAVLEKGGEISIIGYDE